MLVKNKSHFLLSQHRLVVLVPTKCGERIHPVRDRQNRSIKMKIMVTFIGTALCSVMMLATYSVINSNKYSIPKIWPIINYNLPSFNIAPTETTNANASWTESNSSEKMWRPSLFPSPSKLANFPDFQFVINRDICGADRVDLLILIGSKPTNLQMRNLLRQKWGFGPRDDNYVVKMAFLFGKPDEKSLQQSLVNESETYQDIVQGNFRDNYHNVTLRDLMGLRWTWRQCWQARFVMRTDDDISMDLARILDALEEAKFPKDDYVACYFTFSFAPVLRTGRYGISREEFPKSRYDTYCQGWTYWLSTGAAKKLDMAALEVKPFWMNDAYITGSLVKHLGWKHFSLPIRYTNEPMDLERLAELNDTTNYAPLVHGPNDGNVRLAEKVQNYFQLYAKINGYPRHRPPGFVQTTVINSQTKKQWRPKPRRKKPTSLHGYTEKR